MSASRSPPTDIFSLSLSHARAELRTAPITGLHRDTPRDDDHDAPNLSHKTGLTLPTPFFPPLRLAAAEQQSPTAIAVPRSSSATARSTISLPPPSPQTDARRHPPLLSSNTTSLPPLLRAHVGDDHRLSASLRRQPSPLSAGGRGTPPCAPLFVLSILRRTSSSATTGRATPASSLAIRRHPLFPPRRAGRSAAGPRRTGGLVRLLFSWAAWLGPGRDPAQWCTDPVRPRPYVPARGVI
jgi:hypothetical protein